MNQPGWFTENVQPHEAALRSYLQRKVPSVSDVDDVIQESYLKLLRSQPKGGIASVKAYLFVIARNTAAKLFRKQKIFSPEPVDDLPSWRLLDEKEDVAQTVNTRLQSELLAEVVAKLPSRRREILLLRMADELSPVEIADRLRLSESTVRTQLARALENCSQHLRDRGVIPEL